MRVDLGPASYLEVTLRCPSIHTCSHTQQFPRIFCVNPKLVSADGGFLRSIIGPSRLRALAANKQIRQRCWILAHSLVGFDTAPLRVANYTIALVRAIRFVGETVDGDELCARVITTEEIVL